MKKTINPESLCRVAIFATGTGTNTQNLIQHFQSHPFINITLVVTNNPKAGVIEKVWHYNLPCVVINNNLAQDSTFLLELLQKWSIDFVVLAGYIRQIPSQVAQAYDKRMINLHPSLLPKFGGKGMYGHHVHKAVLAADEQTTGITIHYVDAEIDTGEVIFQAAVPIVPGMTVDEVAAAVHRLEQAHLSTVTEIAIRTFYGLNE